MIFNIDIIHIIVYNVDNSYYLSNLFYSCRYYYNINYIFIDFCINENDSILSTINSYLDKIILIEHYRLLDGLKCNPRTDLKLDKLDKLDKYIVYTGIYKYLLEYKNLKIYWRNQYFYNYPIIYNKFEIYMYLYNKYELKITIKTSLIKNILEHFNSNNVLDFLNLKPFFDKYMVYDINKMIYC